MEAHSSFEVKSVNLLKLTSVDKGAKTVLLVQPIRQGFEANFNNKFQTSSKIPSKIKT